MSRRYRPFLLTLLIVVLDQASKAAIVRYVPENTVLCSLFGDFLRIVHVRNTAVAFSLGTGFAMPVKVALFIVLPLLVMVLVCVYIVRDEDGLTGMQRWLLAAFAGGGIGNLLDRIFRGMSVVDFISTNNYGWFGMERFPTYNIADASIVISVILLMFTLIFSDKGEKKKNE